MASPWQTLLFLFWFISYFFMFLFHDRLIFIYTTQATLLNYIIINESVQFFFFLRSWPSSRDKDLFPFSAYRFDSLYAFLSSLRRLTCLLGLQGVQWVRGLVVVRVSCPGHPGLYKKKSMQYSWLSERYIIVITMCFKI